MTSLQFDDRIERDALDQELCRSTQRDWAAAFVHHSFASASSGKGPKGDFRNRAEFGASGALLILTFLVVGLELRPCDMSNRATVRRTKRDAGNGRPQSRPPMMLLSTHLN